MSFQPSLDRNIHARTTSLTLLRSPSREPGKYSNLSLSCSRLGFFQFSFKPSTCCGCYVPSHDRDVEHRWSITDVYDILPGNIGTGIDFKCNSNNQYFIFYFVYLLTHKRVTHSRILVSPDHILFPNGNRSLPLTNQIISGYIRRIR